MIPLYTQEQFDTAKTTDKLLCQCTSCDKPFLTTKREIKYAINGRISAKFCSPTCHKTTLDKKEICNCSNCNLEFKRKPSQLKSSKNYFCSKSCSVTYNNKNKTHGTRRSKLEIYLEQELSQLYPNIEFAFNQKSAIGSELDIYIPSLSLAFELNGIFHYEPIFGLKKLDQIQANDINKSKGCLDNKIDLCIIDVSTFKHFKPIKAQKYLDIIVNIINQRTSLTS